MVYRGIKHGDGFEKPVVIKLPKKGFTEPLILEGVVGAQLSHTNVRGTIHLGGTVKHQVFLVLEYVDGWSLARILSLARRAEMAIPVPVVAFVLHEVCEGLAHLHTTRTYPGPGETPDYHGRILHRDLKPGNVLVSRRGDVKLIDFGLLSSATPDPEDEADPHAVAAGCVQRSTEGLNGTPRYMAPEQAGAINGIACTQTDVFAAGLILYEMLTGKRVNAGRGDTEAIRSARMGVGAVQWTEVHDLHEGLAAIFARATRYLPVERYRKAQDMRDELALLRSTDPAEMRRFVAQVQELDELDTAARAKTDPAGRKPQPSE